MTSSDVISLLDTLWRRATDIPCRPDARLAFHCSTVLGGIGGWRPGSLVKIKYRDVSVAWIRDPTELRLGRWYTERSITSSKEGTRSQEISARGNVLLFSSPTPTQIYAPDNLILWILVCDFLCQSSPINCSASSLFTIRAIADNAFDAGFKSCHQVLSPPPLEKGVDFVPLKWKPTVLDQEIVPISYATFWQLWNRVYFVAGSRERKRPYSLRVGAGGRLNGKGDL